jgi:hypothetical protein
MPDSEIDYQTSMQIKGFPIPVSRPGDLRHDMELIGSFWDEPPAEKEAWNKKENWKDHRLHTPTEVAHYIKKCIDEFYDNRGDESDPEPEPTPTPSHRKKITI